MVDLETIRAGWDDAAREDAMFYIITDPARSQGGWTAEEFFAHGRREIDAAMDRLKEVAEVRMGRALDFGCGIGRLTQALAAHFKRVDGVDVSTEMIDRARSHNQHPGRVEYHLNGERLPFRAGTFDFVYSMIVLQHMPQVLQQGYVEEFFRVLKPGGLAMFAIPDGSDFQHPNGWLSMYGVPAGTVETWIVTAGGTLIDGEDLGRDGTWQNLRYTAVAS